MTIRRTFAWSIVILVLVTQITTVSIALYFAARDAEDRAREALEIANAVATSFMEEQRHQLSMSLQVLARDFPLRKAIATEDVATAQSALSNHAARIEADHAMLISKDGRLLTSTGGEVPVDRNLLREITSRPDRFIALTDRDDNLYQVVLAPIRAPELIAWVSMAFRIDDALAYKIRSLTGTEVSFRGSRSADAVTYASTEMAGDSHQSSNFNLIREFQSLGTPLILELTISKDQALDAFFELRNFTMWLSLFAIVAAALLGLGLARHFTRGLSELTSVAQRVERGDYGTPLPEIHGEETAKLAGALQAMQEGIANREARIRHQALFDPLTGLPNQASALEVLRTRLDQPRAQMVAVVAVIRGLQDLNSSLGVETGDLALRKIARLIQDSKFDYVARLADTRFLLTLPGDDYAQVEQLCEDLERTLQLVTVLPEVQARFNIYFGAAANTDDCDADLLIRHAWSASLEAAAQRRVLIWHTFDSSARRERRLTIARDLRAAPRQNQLTLVYQPKYDTRERLCGVEALLRWEHPTLGMVPVDEFIAVAEQTNDIQTLTSWVLENSIEQIAQWRTFDDKLHVAVNVAASDVAQSGLVADIRRLLTRYNLPGEALQIEVTEGDVVENLAAATTNLRQITELGVKVAIDDYGTGYSSLSQLNNLPANILKIDKSFVMTLASKRHNQQIVRSTIELGHALGLEVVAEGVEDADAMRRLQEWKCDYLQGYFLSRPIAADDVTRLLSEPLQLVGSRIQG